MAAHRRWIWLIVGVLPVAVGCYTYVPLDTTAGLPAGEHVAVEISDRGRAELSDRLGRGVLRLEGTLTRSDSQDVTMNVWRVAQIGGVTSKWSGESVQFRKDFVSAVQGRTLNRGKTYLAAGFATVGLVLLIKSTGLIGAFISGDDPPVVGPPASSRGW